jgi:hypothetical protein
VRVCDLLAGAALPDANHRPLDGVLAAERARVGGVLGDLDLLDLLTQRGTVAGTVLADDPDLSGATSHFGPEVVVRALRVDF